MKRSVLGRAIALMVDAGMTISDATVVANAIGTEFAAQGFYAGARASEDRRTWVDAQRFETSRKRCRNHLRELHERICGVYR